MKFEEIETIFDTFYLIDDSPQIGDYYRDIENNVFTIIYKKDNGEFFNCTILFTNKSSELLSYKIGKYYSTRDKIYIYNNFNNLEFESAERIKQ